MPEIPVAINVWIVYKGIRGFLCFTTTEYSRIVEKKTWKNNKEIKKNLSKTERIKIIVGARLYKSHKAVSQIRSDAMLIIVIHTNNNTASGSVEP